MSSALMTYYLEVPSVGNSGGIALLWVTVTHIRQSTQELHAMIQVIPNHISCTLSIIYASNLVANRKLLWDSLYSLSRTTRSPWLVAGDFNDILCQKDKWGGVSYSRKNNSDFKNCVNCCQLLDLGFKGSRYTWSNLPERSHSLILERLDCCFINSNWFDYYPNSSVTHLPKTHSDHNPLQINLFNLFVRPRVKPFRLESFWYRHPDFKNIVHQCWHNHSYIEAKHIFKDKITAWRKNHFGNIFKQKRILLARLSGIQNFSSYPYSSFLQNLESTLTREYNNILKMEEDYWKIRSRINWLNNGDANTKFYHISVSNRTRKIGSLSFKTILVIGILTVLRAFYIPSSTSSLCSS
ncbi:hypothetical protein KY290_017197 [Solanum tuberosum]|uniref:Endonuclease/exonuclease/phosphatase domain-containing protein n=1 Tax=Solanum tuberosum TaxID=4113 RepID=A0ABQ7VC77_SOLTU|nr:hypothetical protein KY284_016232 [Solanum tuberosum]KAH0701960.1 hypothetical protein KY285_016238 [Solanum tuberosum]KAH0761124.1 hypothetical protein KY290_017197 [Solanum tuberosum]